MKIRKRNGEIVDFERSKITTSVSNASDGINQPMTQSDVNRLADDVERVLDVLDKEYISYDELHKLVVKRLNASGFSAVGKEYDRFSKLRVREPASV